MGAKKIIPTKIQITWSVEAIIDESVEEIGETIASIAGENSSLTAMLLFEEAFVNIASYAYPTGQSEKPVYIEAIKPQNSPLQLILKDRGFAFNPTSYFYGTTDANQIGGHGIRMMRELSSVFYYKREDDTNVLMLILKE